MKIAVWHNLPSGGGKRALYYHVRGLVERGHLVEVWCPPSADQTYLPLNTLVPEHIVPLPGFPISKKTGVKKILTNLTSVTDKITAMHEHCRQSAREMQNQGFDVVLANSCSMLGVPPIGHYLQIPKVIYLGEPVRWLYEASPDLIWSAIKPPLNKWDLVYVTEYLRDLQWIQQLRVQVREESSNARVFDKILVNSLFSRESILRTYGTDAKVCYLGVDTQHFIARNEERENFIIGLGAVKRAKNVHLVIKALGEIERNRPSLCWVANTVDEVYLKEIKCLSDQIGVDFYLKQKVADDELISMLNRAMVMIYAPRLEPFGFAPLEANACGAPVVAVAEGGVRETIIDNINGLLVESDPKEMAKAITLIMSNKQFAHQLGESARKNVLEKWSLEKAVRRLENELSGVV